MTEPKLAWWRPGALAARRARLAARTRALAATRRFFDQRDFVEVETPVLQVSPGLEPHLMAFATELVAPDGGSKPLYLHTSPEFAMKKLLVAGEKRIYQLARVFRNGERSDTHHPEFVMLEWYRANADYRELMADCIGLLQAVRAAVGPEPWRWRGRVSDPDLPWTRLSVVQAFRHYAGLDLMACIDDARNPAATGLAEQARRLDIRCAADDSWDDIFFRIFLERIEPELGHPAPTIVYDYPIRMAALARPKPDDPRLAERFELYVAGLELANAFGELTDAAEQGRRFTAERALRLALYGSAYPVDADFLAALEFGLPPSAGIALGFDRLVMLATGAARIDDVLWAPVAGAR